MLNPKNGDESLRRRYMSYFHDGLWDITLGLWLILGALLIWWDFIYIVAVWIVLTPPMLWSVKQRVTLPRLTKEDLAAVPPAAVSRVKLVLLVAGVVLLLAGLMVFMTFLAESPLAPLIRSAVLILTLVTVVGLFAWMGYRFGMARFYAYAGLVVLFAAALAWLPEPWLNLPLMMAALGAIISLVGTVILIRFMRSHPKLPEKDRPAW